MWVRDSSLSLAVQRHTSASLSPLPQTASPPGPASFPRRPFPSYPVPAGLGSGGRTRLEGTGSQTAKDRQDGVGVAVGAGRGGGTLGPTEAGQGEVAAAGASPAAQCTAWAGGWGGRAPAGPGEEGAVRRGRGERLAEPGWPRPRRPRKPRLHLKIPHSGAPFYPPPAALGGFRNSPFCPARQRGH